MALLAHRGDAKLDLLAFTRIVHDVVRASADGTCHFLDFRLASSFQPVFGVREYRAVGFEAFTRALDSSGHPVPSEKLFDERGDVPRLLLDWVSRALHLRNFASIDPGDAMLHLNVRACTAVEDIALTSAFRELIGYYGLSARRVCVEIPGGGCEDESRLAEAVAVYRDLGIAIALGGFGTGRSNIDRLVRLRPDFVRLGRSVLVDAVGDENARRALPSLVGFLRDSGSKVVIEGIESVADADLAIEAGADCLQGFYLGSPLRGFKDDLLTRRILAELVRVRGRVAARADFSGAGALAARGN